MTELTESEQQKLNTTRMIRAEADVLLPLLDIKQANAVGKLIAAFRSGEHTKLTSIAAEITTIHDMKHEITRNIKQAEVLERKAYAGD